MRPHPAWATATSERGPGASPAPALGPEHPKEPVPFLLPGSRPARRAVRAAQSRTSAGHPLPRTAADQGSGGGAHFPRIPSVHRHGRSGRICRPWAPRPPLVAHGRAPGPAGQRPVAASSRLSALPRGAPAAAPSLAPPPSVNTVAARPPRPDAQVGACGAGRHTEAAPRRVPTARAVRPSADPEAGAGLPGREPAHAPRPRDEASGERSGPRTSPHSRAGSGAALLRPRLGVASSAGAEDPELSLRGWEPQARPPGAVVALGLPDTHERISHKRLWAGFTLISKRGRTWGVVRCWRLGNVLWQTVVERQIWLRGN